MLSKCYQYLGYLFNITLVKLLPLLQPRQHASLFFRESQEKLLKMCLKLHIPCSPWQRSFAKLVKRAGENSTAHFWVYGYYFACAAELIECDFGHTWSKGRWPPKSWGFTTGTAEMATILATSPHLLYLQISWKRWEPSRQRETGKE